MFSLLSGFFKWLFEKEETKVLIVGLDHAGKTTLLEQMKGLYRRTDAVPLDKIPPTVGMNLAKIDVGSRRVVFWDLGGQPSMRSLWDHYFAETNGVLFVVDAADGDRFAEASEAYAALLRNPALAGVPALTMANKQDLAEAVNAEAAAKAVGVGEEDLARGRETRCVGVSALTLDGVHEGVAWLLENAIDRDPVDV